MTPRLLLLLFAAASAALADPALYLDLAGPWRVTQDHSPDMARADYDDRNWRTTPIPPGSRRQSALGSTSGWLRRSVLLPEWADRRKLALTLGPFRSVYSVWVNGVHVADAGSFQSRSESTVARTRTFPIPPEAAGPRGPLQIAIRFGWPMGGGAHLQAEPSAPYLITYRENAPLAAGVRDLLVLQARYMPAVFFATVYLLFGLLLLFAWWSERKPAELPWFVAYLLVSSLNRWLHHFELLPSATPFNSYGTPSAAVITSMLSWILFASFAIAVTGRQWRWLQAALWTVGGALTLAFLGPGSRPGYRLVGILCGAAGLFVIAHAWLKETNRLSTGRKLFYACLLLASAYRLWLNQFGDVQGYVQIHQYSVLLPDLLSLTLTVAITGLLLDQIAKDRREHQRLQGEMDAARQAQLYLLGSEAAPQSPAFIREEVYEPALAVGGDFHWSRADADGSLIVVVGDVSGKGLKAALLVSLAIGILRNEKSDSPAAILAALNDGLAGHTGGGFVTCCCARFQPDGPVILASAGHPAPYADGHELDIAAGLPLGLAPGVTYDEFAVTGTQFTLVSDGVVEAENAQRELFGFERTRAISTKSAQEIADAAKAWGQNDDITVVTVRRNS